jgi:hypothetical protein
MQCALYGRMCAAQSMGSILQAHVKPEDAYLHTYKYQNIILIHQLSPREAFAIAGALSLLSSYHYYQ